MAWLKKFWLKLNKKYKEIHSKNTDIYYTGYIKMKGFDCINNLNINPLCFIIVEVDEFIAKKLGINT